MRPPFQNELFNTILGLVMLLAIVGCDDNTPTPTLEESIDVGVVIDAFIVPTSFNKTVKSTIKTEKGIFSVVGMPSVFKGESAEVQKYNNGTSYLCVASWNSCRRIFH